VAIIIDEETRVVVQGLTGREGRFHALRNRAYGTKVVAGVTPGKGGESVEGIPVFDTVDQAVEATGANTALIFVPARFAGDAVYEAAGGGVGVIVCITEGIPAHDEARFVNYVRRSYPETMLIGPNCPGLISPGKSNVGIMPSEITLPGGPVGLVSRSGTLTYQAVHELTQRGIGQTTCVGIGGDPVPGTGFIECLSLFEADPETKAVVMIGEIGGSDEETAAEFIASEMIKPVVGYVAGVTAPPGKKMGHAGAIVSGSKGTAAAKIGALEKAGARVARNPSEIGDLMAEVLRGR
jgi:succinyl-CoA synthetase alpha subunit